MTESQQIDFAPLEPNKVSVRGIYCKAFPETHKIKKNQHKIPLGTINPVHQYNDPRREPPVVDINIKGHQKDIHLEEITKALGKEKPFLKEHLTNPYTYIKKVVSKKKVEKGLTFTNHKDKWDRSTHLVSTRSIQQHKKSEITNNTKSWTPQIDLMSSKQNDPQSQRRIILENNIIVKDHLSDFFEMLKHCLNEGYIIDTANGHKYRNPRNQNQNLKQSKKVKFLGEEEETVEKPNLSLKHVWNKYVEINGLGVKGWVVEDDPESGKTNYDPTYEQMILAKNKQDINWFESVKYMDSDQVQTYKSLKQDNERITGIINDKRKMAVDKGVFMDFMTLVGYPQKRMFEVEQFFNHIQDFGEITYVEYHIIIILIMSIQYSFYYKTSIYFTYENIPVNQRIYNNSLVNEDEDGESQRESSPNRTRYQDVDIKNSTMYRDANGELVKSYRIAVRKGQENQEVSMKSLIYNFEKYFKEKNKITYLLSQRAASERSVSIRTIFEDYLNKYPQYKEELNLQRDFEDEILINLKNECDDYNYVEINKLYEQLRIKEASQTTGYRLNKEERDTLNNEIQEIKSQIEYQMVQYQDIYLKAKELVEQMIENRDKIHFQRRALCKWFHPFNNSTLAPDDANLRQNVIELSSQTKQNQEHLEQFYEDFTQEKQNFKENSFKLFEIATFIYDNAYTKTQLDVISKLVEKYPNRLIPMEILEKTYQLQMEKFSQNLDFIASVYDNIRDESEYRKTEMRNHAEQLPQKIPVNERIYTKNENKSERVEKILEQNVVLHLIQTKFLGLEKEYKKLMNHLNQICQYATDIHGEYGLFANLIYKIYDLKLEQVDKILNQKLIRFGGKCENQSQDADKIINKPKVTNTINRFQQQQQMNEDLDLINTLQGNRPKYDEKSQKDISDFLLNENNLAQSKYQ